MATTISQRPISLPSRSFQARRQRGSATVAVSASAHRHSSLAVSSTSWSQRNVAPLPSSFTDEDLAFLRSEGLTLEETKAGSRRLEMAERQILAIATDVDGTLLDNQQELSERTERALLLAQEQGVQVILATGKTRGPWVHDVIHRLGLRTPGVFLQGLLVCDADGSVLYERTMSRDVSEEVVAVAEQLGITLVACNGERILCSRSDHHTDRLVGYGEPIPEAVGSLRDVLHHTSIHKFLFMADDAILDDLRPSLEVQLAGRASLVTALHGMLEVLPPGASKAVGLTHALKIVGVHPTQVMAAGDGENDIEMLQMAGLAVAMGNARPAVKAVADVISQTNDDDGLAAAVERFVLPAGLWCWD